MFSELLSKSGPADGQELGDDLASIVATRIRMQGTSDESNSYSLSASHIVHPGEGELMRRRRRARFSSGNLAERRATLMSKLLSSILAIFILIGISLPLMAQEKKTGNSGEQDMNNGQQNKKQTPSDDADKNAKVMLELFSAVERYDARRQFALYQPDVEFHWPPSLYGGNRPSWDETWLPLQPTWAERRMDPRIVAASADEVVVLWHQRGISPSGERFDGEVLGFYRLRDGKLARAQMFYFDTAAAASFLARAISPELRKQMQTVFGQLNTLPFARQAAVGQVYGELLMVSPNKRQEMLNSEKLKSQLADEDRALLRKLLALHANRDGGIAIGQAPASQQP
jgi:ketosteroid isomerase-like protein